MEISLETLLKSGAHFGHLSRKWNPRMKPYILMDKNGIHIIDLKKTIAMLDDALRFLREVVRNGGLILFVGTKKQARAIVQEQANRCGMFYVVERWLGGTLTNFSTIRKSIRRLEQLEKDKSSDKYDHLTKKEVLTLERERIKLSDLHRGIRDMKRLPDALVVVDVMEEDIAVKEANRLDIPVIGIVDTNSDPVNVDYPIPANDDSIRTIRLIVTAIADAIQEARASSRIEMVEEPTTGNE